jgi:hypothetical protein
MVTYGFFNSQNGDRKYNADQMSEYFKGLISDGVYESVGDGMVVEAAEGMTVSIGTGRAVIDCKWMDSSSDEQITISAADPVNPRYTAIVVRLDRTRRLMEFDAVDGEAAADPDYPAATWTDNVKELVLAYILVSAGATSISQSDITDARSLDVCGWVTGLIEQISIENLYLAWVDKFNQYYVAMEENYEAWFDMLTEDLNVSTYIRKFKKRAVLTSGEDNNHIPLDMTNYTYNTDDVVSIYINGLYGSEDIDWSLDTSTTPPEIITVADAVGTEVCIEILKSKVGFNALIGANNETVVDQNGGNILLGGD